MENMQTYSVLMAVYYKENAEYLKAAIESMLKQTIPPDDFVLVCDGPLTDQLNHVIEKYEKDSSGIQVVRLAENSGLGNALNAGLQYCKNDLVARMDSDDIALSDRCEKQIRRFEQNKNLALCSGTIAEFQDTPEKIIAYRKVPSLYTDILKFAKKRNPMNHMAVMFRKKAVMEAGNYIEVNLAEDYYLWARMLKKGFEAENIEDVLVYARIGNGMYKRRGGITYIKSVCELQKLFLEMHFISPLQYIWNCTLRSCVYIWPESWRKAFYNKVLRVGK